MTASPATSPFAEALGPLLEEAAPAVRRHLSLAAGRSAHQGFIRRRWARGLAGRTAARVLHLGGGCAPNGGERFELRNEIVVDGGGGVAMLWHRTHHSTSGPVSGIGVLRWEPSRRVLIDSIGKGGRLEVELVPMVEDRAVVMASRRQWFRLGRLRLPLPRIFFGTAVVREWEEPDGRLGLSLTLSHLLFGAYAGYEAVLRGERR
jgi:hypothetical protein